MTRGKSPQSESSGASAATRFVACFALALGIASCASTRHVPYSRSTPAFIPSTLRFAECSLPEKSFQGLDFEKIGDCLRGSIEIQDVVYRLRYGKELWLELTDPEDAPECVRTLLSRLPVPREIMFQTVERKQLACYSAAIDRQRNELLGAKVPFKGNWSLTIRFPLESAPLDAGETLRTLITWSLTPVWRANGDTPRVDLVADSVCERCLGEGSFVRRPDPRNPRPDTWPIPAFDPRDPAAPPNR